MINQVIRRSSIRRMALVANKQKGLCNSFSSTSGTSNNNNNTKCSNNNAKERIRTTPFTSAAVGGSSPSWSDISVGRSSSISNSNKASGMNTNYGTSRFVGKTSYSNNAGSNLNDERSSGPEFRSVYVHPLSQIVLEYLQDSHHEWIVSRGLDQSLTMHRDGSFELKHVPQSLSSMTTAAPLPLPPLSSSSNNKIKSKSKFEPLISTSTSPRAVMKSEQSKGEKSTTNVTNDRKIAAEKSSISQQQRSGVSTIDNNDNMRIWTSYDEQEKKHWLTVRRGLFRQRFLLQDNLLTAWQGNRGMSLPQRLQVAVDEMIRAINRLDQKQKQQIPTIGQQQWHQKGQRRFRKR